MIVCLCHAVSDREILGLIDTGRQTVRELADACAAGTDCGSCATDLARLVRQRRAGAASEPPRAK